MRDKTVGIETVDSLQYDYDNLMRINTIPAKTEVFIKQDSGIWKGLYIS